MNSAIHRLMNVLIAGVALLSSGAWAAGSPIAASPDRERRITALRNAADAITSHQLADGAIVMGGSKDQSYSVVPYFANLAAFGLTRAGEITSSTRHLDGAQRWLTWYLDHRNADGTICDFRGAPGRWLSTGGFDSTDSYPATFLEVAERVEKRTADPIWKNRLYKAIPELLAAQRITLQPSGLTAAKPGYDMLYTMDNIEVYRGLMAAARMPDWDRIAGADPQTQAAPDRQAALTFQAITSLLFDANGSPPHYRIGINSRRAPADAKDLAKWYPDQMTQLMAIAWLPRSETHKDLFDGLKSHYYADLPNVIQTEEHLDRLVWWTMAAQNAPDGAVANALIERICSYSPRNKTYNTALFGHVCRILAEAIETGK